MTHPPRHPLLIALGWLALAVVLSAGAVSLTLLLAAMP